MVNGKKVKGMQIWVMTNIGRMTLSLWLQSAEHLVTRAGDEEKLDELITFTRTLPWLHKEEEIRKHALQLYCRPEKNNTLNWARCKMCPNKCRDQAPQEKGWHGLCICFKVNM